MFDKTRSLSRNEDFSACAQGDFGLEAHMFLPAVGVLGTASLARLMPPARPPAVAAPSE